MNHTGVWLSVDIMAVQFMQYVKVEATFFLSYYSDSEFEMR
jgi:hypothetical protein